MHVARMWPAGEAGKDAGTVSSLVLGLAFAFASRNSVWIFLLGELGALHGRLPRCMRTRARQLQLQLHFAASGAHRIGARGCHSKACRQPM